LKAKQPAKQKFRQAVGKVSISPETSVASRRNDIGIEQRACMQGASHQSVPRTVVSGQWSL